MPAGGLSPRASLAEGSRSCEPVPRRARRADVRTRDRVAQRGTTRRRGQRNLRELRGRFPRAPLRVPAARRLRSIAGLRPSPSGRYLVVEEEGSRTPSASGRVRRTSACRRASRPSTRSSSRRTSTGWPSRRERASGSSVSAPRAPASSGFPWSCASSPGYRASGSCSPRPLPRSSCRRPRSSSRRWSYRRRRRPDDDRALHPLGLVVADRAVKLVLARG